METHKDVCNSIISKNEKRREPDAWLLVQCGLASSGSGESVMWLWAAVCANGGVT